LTFCGEGGSFSGKMSSLTLGLCVERLPASVVPQPDPPDLAGFDAQAELRNNINRVLERFFAEGKYVGTIQQATITAYEDVNDNKFITLPRHLETCLRGGKAGHKTTAVQSEWYQYLPQGRGIRKQDQAYYGPLQDIGEGYVTFRDIETASTLTLSSGETECAGSYIWIRGKDANGDKIFSTVDGDRVEGIRLDLGNGTQTTTGITFKEIYSVEKTPTTGVVSLSAGATTLAKYEAGERVVSYRRYLVDRNWDAVQGIFKRKHCWAISDNDPLYPDSLEAIKLGLMALNAEEKADVERGQYYMDRAILLLNAELKEYNAGQEGVMQIAPWLTRRLVNMT
jgi:hypothetical protein